jgi:hypothetical protein
MDYIIAGGGIAGLYTASILIDKYNVDPNKITLVEKSGRFGGRIHTKEHETIHYEAGAGRIPNTHTILLKLLDKLVEIPNRHNFRLVMNNDSKLVDRNDIEKLFEQVQSMTKNNNIGLVNISFAEYLYSRLGYATAKTFIEIFGYDGDFYLDNAYSGLKTMETDFNISNKYYVLRGGLEQLVDKIVKKLENSGVKMILKSKLTNWENNTATFSNIEGTISTIRANELILALDQRALLSLSFLNQYQNVLNNVVGCPVYRIYAKFPLIDGKCWFDSIPKTTTNLNIRMFIPIDYSNGFCLISYTDNNTANEWHRHYLDGNLQPKILEEIQKLFPDKKIPEPIFFDPIYWYAGVHFWNLGATYESTSDKLKSLNICGETYSNHHGWIEGALETAITMCDNLFSRNLKIYTIDEVAKSDSLTVIHNKVYDLSIDNWLEKHPGGSIIKQAIGKDATDMFEYVGHPDYVYDLMTKFQVGIIKEDSA